MDYETWNREHGAGKGAPASCPMGGRALRSEGMRLVWSDADHRVPWTTRPLRELKDAVEHRRDGLHVLGPLLSLHKVARADVTLAVLENSGLFLARQRLRSRWRSATSPLVIMSCWLAESARHFDGRALEWHRETLRAADAILFWSSNQRKIFRELLGVPDQRLRFVPFGIDHRFFSPGPPGDESYVFSAGNDRARDYGVLLEAAAGLDVRLQDRVPARPGSRLGTAPQLRPRGNRLTPALSRPVEPSAGRGGAIDSARIPERADRDARGDGDGKMLHCHRFGGHTRLRAGLPQCPDRAAARCRGAPCRNSARGG